MHLIDTQFLFGLRSSDKHFAKCKKILQYYGNQVRISSLSFIEVTLVLKAKKKSESEISDFIKEISIILSTHGIKELPFISKDLIQGLNIKIQNPKITFFDAMICGISLSNSLGILGDDVEFSKIKQIRHITFDKFLESNK